MVSAGFRLYLVPGRNSADRMHERRERCHAPRITTNLNRFQRVQIRRIDIDDAIYRTKSNECDLRAARHANSDWLNTFLPNAGNRKRNVLFCLALGNINDRSRLRVLKTPKAECPRRELRISWALINQDVRQQVEGRRINRVNQVGRFRRCDGDFCRPARRPCLRRKAQPKRGPRTKEQFWDCCTPRIRRKNVKNLGGNPGSLAMCSTRMVLAAAFALSASIPMDSSPTAT